MSYAGIGKYTDADLELLRLDIIDSSAELLIVMAHQLAYAGCTPLI